MVEYMEAIKKPFQDLQTAAIGIVIGMIPLVSLLVSGYGIGVGRKTLNKDKKLPKWSADQLGTYIKDLVMAFVISIVYMIPAIILIAIAAVTAISSILAAASAGEEAFAAAMVGLIGTGGILLLVGILLVIAASLITPIAVMYYIKEKNLGAAFQVGKILKKVLTVKYILTMIVLFVYVFVLIIVMGVLSAIPVAGTFLGTGIMTYAMSVTGYTMYAEVFNETP